MGRLVAVIFILGAAVMLAGAVRLEGTATLVTPTSATSTASDFLPLVPGESAGQVALGQGLDDCVRILGPATLAEDMDDGQMVSWNRLGISVQLAKGGHPMLQANVVDPLNTVVVGILVSSTRYRTASGLKVGSSRSQVQQVLGPGDVRNSMLAYPALGITFMLTEDQVQQILVFPKNGGG